MSLQSKPLVGKGISSLKPRLRLGFRGRNFFADLGLGLQRYISWNQFVSKFWLRFYNTLWKIIYLLFSRIMKNVLPKFREINTFTKYIIWRNIFYVRVNFSFYHTVLFLLYYLNILFLPKGKGKNKILTRLKVKFLPAGWLKNSCPRGEAARARILPSEG